MNQASDNAQEGESAMFFRLAGITFRVEADIPLTDRTFDPKLNEFRVDGPGPDTVVIRHHIGLPVLESKQLGVEVYRKAPWAIYRNDRITTYLGILERSEDLWKVVVFNDDYSVGDFYHPDDSLFLSGRPHSLTTLPTDQIYIAALLADRGACYLHSSAAVWNGQGLLFVGHSEAGKSTTVKLIKDRAEILCDDRNIVRKVTAGETAHQDGDGESRTGTTSPQPSPPVGGEGVEEGQSAETINPGDISKDHCRMQAADGRLQNPEGKAGGGTTSPQPSPPGAERGRNVGPEVGELKTTSGFRVYGTWSHGEVPLVSANSAPLRAILFLEKAQHNRLIRVSDRREILARLLACLIRPLESRDWWDKTLALVEAVSRTVPCHIMEFDKSGGIADELEALTREG